MDDNIMDETPDTKSIWNKTQDELTLGDSMKATAVVMAVMVVATGALTAAPVVVDAVRTKFRARRAAKRARQDESTQDEI